MLEDVRNNLRRIDDFVGGVMSTLGWSFCMLSSFRSFVISKKLLSFVISALQSVELRLNDEINNASKLATPNVHIPWSRE